MSGVRVYMHMSAAQSPRSLKARPHCPHRRLKTFWRSHLAKASQRLSNKTLPREVERQQDLLASSAQRIMSVFKLFASTQEKNIQVFPVYQQISFPGKEQYKEKKHSGDMKGMKNDKRKILKTLTA